MTFPDDVLPKTPILRDGLDSITTADIQAVEDNLSGLQTTIGTRPAGQLSTMAELLRDNCRVATGNMFGSYIYSGSYTVTINGHTWTYSNRVDGEGFWRQYREYFLDDKSDSLFVGKPIVYFQCKNPWPVSVLSNYVGVMGSSYVTQSFFSPTALDTAYGNVTSSSDVYYDVDWLAIEPINGAVDISQIMREGLT